MEMEPAGTDLVDDTTELESRQTGEYHSQNANKKRQTMSKKINRRDTLKKIGTGTAALTGGIVAGSSNAAAGDKAGTPYCHEQPGDCSDRKFERGTRVVVSPTSRAEANEDINDENMPTAERATATECCTPMGDPCNPLDKIFFGCETITCDVVTRLSEGDRGTVRATCARGTINAPPQVLVEWDKNGKEGHVGQQNLREISGTTGGAAGGFIR